MERKRISLAFDIPWPTKRLNRRTLTQAVRAWLPSRGNVLFTLLVVGGLLWAASAGALPLRAPAAAGTSTGTIAYQGRLADANGSPLTGTYNMIFRLYDAATGGTPLWTEQWTGSNGVKVSDGLFNVMLGSLTPIPTSLVTDHSSLFLGITVGTDDEMTPRVQLGTVPFAVQALTVPDGSVTTAKIADGAVTQAKLGVDVSMVPPDGSVTTAKLANGAVTQAKAPTMIASMGSLSNVRIYYWGGCNIPPTGYHIQWPNPFNNDVSVVATPWQGEGSGGAEMVVATNPPGLQDFATGAVIHIFDRNGTQVGGCAKVIAIGR
jgi:hypothetical protein